MYFYTTVSVFYRALMTSYMYWTVKKWISYHTYAYGRIYWRPSQRQSYLRQRNLHCLCLCTSRQYINVNVSLWRSNSRKPDCMNLGKSFCCIACILKESPPLETRLSWRHQSIIRGRLTRPAAVRSWTMEPTRQGRTIPRQFWKWHRKVVFFCARFHCLW